MNIRPELDPNWLQYVNGWVFGKRQRNPALGGQTIGEFLSLGNIPKELQADLATAILLHTRRAPTDLSSPSVKVEMKRAEIAADAVICAVSHLPLSPDAQAGLTGLH